MSAAPKPQEVLRDRRGRNELLFDWNHRALGRPKQPIEVHDETLRDGLQSPSVEDPPLSEKIALLELMGRIGVTSANIGLPGAGPRAFQDSLALAKHIARKRGSQPMPGATCAGRTLEADLRPIAEIQQKAGIPVTAYAFIGSSPIRQYVEGWDSDFLLKTSAAAIDFAVREGLEVAYVTEDTTRSSPKTLEPLFRNAIAHGASRLVLCDTVGHATPDGTRALIRWTRRLVDRIRREVRLDWHGHNDRGHALTNSLFAVDVGIDRVHGCGLGVGERVGNAPMDLILLNMRLLGWIDQDLSALVEYVRQVAQSFKVRIPFNYPLAGSDAFRTATGVHAAAIIKARRKGDAWLADRVYSGVPAAEFGKEQQIDIGHMSGMSNVAFWLEAHGLPVDERLCKSILARAKERSRTLTAREVLSLVQAHQAAHPRPSPSQRRGARGPARPHAAT